MPYLVTADLQGATVRFTVDEQDELTRLIGEISSGGHLIDGDPHGSEIGSPPIQQPKMLNGTSRGMIRFAVREIEE